MSTVIWPWQRWSIRYAMRLCARHAKAMGDWNYGRLGRYGIADIGRSNFEYFFVPANQPPVDPRSDAQRIDDDQIAQDAEAWRALMKHNTGVSE